MRPKDTPRATFLSQWHRALDLIVGHFDSAWSIDHLQSSDDELLEGFTTLTYAAARHPQLQFGHTVICQSFRNPALLAKIAATLQLLSGGRYIFGLGAGAVVVDNRPQHSTVVRDAQAAHGALPPHFFIERYTDAYIAELQAFVDALRRGEAPQVGGADGRAPVVIALAAQRSLAERCPVNQRDHRNMIHITQDRAAAAVTA
ncbi:MAG TPA: LLM class flavin-dependent oxidoreductase [Roseiflexaceae bacterium]|nr:LLM class flavin-dependent oxidoreductase [Roseiflexaceae bacterium]